MEVHPGVFVSNVATEDDWRPDPEVGGDAEEHVLFDGEGSWAGLSRVTDTSDATWTPPSREVLLVLEGEVQIEIAEGPTLELKVGDMACLPGGVETTWHFLKLPFKEMAILL